MLESLLITADKEGCESGIFDLFPLSVTELNNCQWQVIYHGFFADLLFAISDVVFQKVTMSDESWFSMVATLKEDLCTVDDVTAFISEADRHSSSMIPDTSRTTDDVPKLRRLLPLLELLLQLRSLVYAKDISLSASVIDSILSPTFTSVLIDFRLQEGVDKEMQWVKQLLLKHELELQLNQLLTEDSSLSYPFPSADTIISACMSFKTDNANADVETQSTVSQLFFFHFLILSLLTNHSQFSGKGYHSFHRHCTSISIFTPVM
jgi:hypothetical protein